MIREKLIAAAGMWWLVGWLVWGDDKMIPCRTADRTIDDDDDDEDEDCKVQIDGNYSEKRENSNPALLCSAPCWVLCVQVSCPSTF